MRILILREKVKSFKLKINLLPLDVRVRGL